jgi:hypothetical protein
MSTGCRCRPAGREKRKKERDIVRKVFIAAIIALALAMNPIT